MFKFEIYLQKDNHWVYDSDTITDRFPEVNDIIYHHTKPHLVTSINEVEDEYNTYQVFLTIPQTH